MKRRNFLKILPALGVVPPNEYEHARELVKTHKINVGVEKGSELPI